MDSDPMQGQETISDMQPDMMGSDRIGINYDVDTINDRRGGTTEIRVMVQRGTPFCFLSHITSNIHLLATLNRGGEKDSSRANAASPLHLKAVLSDFSRHLILRLDDRHWM